MARNSSPIAAALARPQRARIDLRLGRARAAARVRVTPAGLVAIGALVAAILLSTAVVVRAARAG